MRALIAGGSAWILHRGAIHACLLRFRARPYIFADTLAESLVHRSHSLEYVRPAVYRRPLDANRTAGQNRSRACAL